MKEVECCSMAFTILGNVHRFVFKITVSGIAVFIGVVLGFSRGVLSGQLWSSSDFLLLLLAVAESTGLCPVLGFALIFVQFYWCLSSLSKQKTKTN